MNTHTHTRTLCSVNSNMKSFIWEQNCIWKTIITGCLFWGPAPQWLLTVMISAPVFEKRQQTHWGAATFQALWALTHSRPLLPQHPHPHLPVLAGLGFATGIRASWPPGQEGQNPEACPDQIGTPDDHSEKGLSSPRSRPPPRPRLKYPHSLGLMKYSSAGPSRATPLFTLIVCEK